MQTKPLLPDRIAIRLPVIDAYFHAQPLQRPPQLDGPSQRALIFPAALFPRIIAVSIRQHQRQHPASSKLKVQNSWLTNTT
jgi:hypothetical protein